MNSGVKEVARVFLGPGSNADYAAAGGDDEQSSRQSYRELVNLLKVSKFHVYKSLEPLQVI